MSLQAELLYSDEHVWVKKEGEHVQVGITDFAQTELGDIVFVELPEVGDDLQAEEAFGNVESVKTVSELYAPINGTVVEINEDLEDSPEYINESSFDQGWMIVMDPADEAELDDLMTAAEYEAFTEEDEEQL